MLSYITLDQYQISNEFKIGYSISLCYLISKAMKRRPPKDNQYDFNLNYLLLCVTLEENYLITISIVHLALASYSCDLYLSEFISQGRRAKKIFSLFIALKSSEKHFFIELLVYLIQIMHMLYKKR